MDNGSAMLAFTNIFVGVLIIAVSIPLQKNKIRMNCWYGMRFRKSFKSDENWYKINRYGADRMIMWSIVIIVIGLLTFVIPLETRKSLRLVMRCAPLIAIIPVIETWLFAKKL
jgi:hypothetical protein